MIEPGVGRPVTVTFRAASVPVVSVSVVDKDDKTVSTQAASGVAFTLTVKWSGKRWMLDSLTQG